MPTVSDTLSTADGTAPTSGLRDLTWKRFLHAPDAELVNELYAPALSRAVHYDRCCAYFSSQVLSVAARGFGGLIKNLLDRGDAASKPTMRLLVNEQLEPADLAALTATGDQSKLIDKLLKQFKTPTDALAKNRLEMLTWLVAAGHLEVRVGLMRHTHGLSHAKFGIITDTHGDRLAFMGSDNETGNALVQNYEELTLQTSWQDEEFVSYYGKRFETIWLDKDDSVTTLPLPDAVRAQLIKHAPKSPNSNWFVVQDKTEVKALEVAMRWHFLAAAPYLPNGEYASDATALVDMWPHQHQVVEDTARAFPAGRLLCDQVGMGKTLEAILVLRRLLCGRGVKRALLLVPAGLLKQWQDELREKGGLLVPRWESGFLHQPDGEKKPMEASVALAASPLMLMSREWARLEGNRKTLLAALPWDLILLDEAHAARRKGNEEGGFNSGNLLLSLLRDLQLRRRTRGLLLLSATPMQTQPWEPWDLLGVLGVGGEWMVEFADIRSYYDGLASLSSNHFTPTAGKAVARLVTMDKEFPDPPEGLNAATASALMNSLLVAMPDKKRRYAHWLRHGAPLGRRMHRNTRETLRHYYDKGLLPLPPPKREVIDEVFDYQDQAERDCYDAVEHYINDRFDQLEKEKSGKGFVMTVYRRRASSSPQALRRSLERRLEGLDRVIKKHHTMDWLSAEEVGLDPDDLSDADLDERIDPALPTDPKMAEKEKEQVQSLLEQISALHAADSKFAKFVSVLQAVRADGRAALVFTEYTDTMEYLRDHLRSAHGAALACYSGGGGQVWMDGTWHAVTKAEITSRLGRREIDVLLCTDAASEGLNLQAASALINYDLPWNPSKVEQRIGRIDRIGQAQMVLPIRNLFLDDSVDMRVYSVLRERCGLFTHFVGQMQPVLALARNALQANLRRDQVKTLVTQIDQTVKMVEADSAVASVFQDSNAEMPPHAEPPATRQDLDAALAALASVKAAVSASALSGGKGWRLRGIGKTGKQGIAVTTDRETLERHKDVVPLTLAGPLLKRIADALPLPTTRVPLVLGEYSLDSYRCVEVRWVHDGVAIPVTDARQLSTLIGQWDGRAPAPSVVLKAQDEARHVARSRTVEMKTQSDAEEEASLCRQSAAARFRLLRELARTLRCLGSGDLNVLLQGQMTGRLDGRYAQAYRLLGGYPDWTSADKDDAAAFQKTLSAKDQQSRLSLGSEIDAALNDPRWRAQE